MNQNKNWFDDQPVCVVMCGGKGSRLFPISGNKQKTMIKVNGKPILQHVIEYWKKYTNKFIFVVKHKKEDIINFVKTLNLQAEFIEPAEVRGLADGIHHVKEKVGEKFFVVLGDCICKGDFVFPENMENGVGVCETNQKEDIARSYSVELKEGRIKKVVEKPRIILNNLCGMGFYFFNRNIFNYIAKMCDETDELTNIIQRMIESNEDVQLIPFKGEYLNITYPHDLEKAKEILTD